MSMVFVVLMAVVLVGCTVAAPASDPARSPTATPNAVAPPALTSAPTVSTPTASAPMTPPPSPSPEALPSDLDPDLLQAIRLRLDYGMRADLAYVRMVAEDPRATNLDYGVPVYPEEFDDTQRRYDESRVVAQIVQSYAAAHADEFGGLYIAEATHTGVVSLWTNHLAEHAGAIVAAAGPQARLAFAQVKYPEAELRILQDRIGEDWRAAWLDDIPAAFQGIGVDIIASQVFVEISSANPQAEAIVEAHYDLGDRLRVESDGIGVAFIPRGTIKGRVTPIAGVDLGLLNLQWTSDDPGDCGGGDIGYGVDALGRFELPCQVGTRTVIVSDEDGELGRGTVVVRADKTVTLTITLSR